LRDKINATRQWWRSRRAFELFISELVIEEASAGDEDAARRRLRTLKGLARLPVSDEAKALARTLVARAALPARAEVDALHVAIAALNGMEFLLTWNCRHLANAILRGRIEEVCRMNGIEPPVICTPLELTEVRP